MAFKMKGNPMQRNFPGAFKKNPWKNFKKGLGEVWTGIKSSLDPSLGGTGKSLDAQASDMWHKIDMQDPRRKLKEGRSKKNK